MTRHRFTLKCSVITVQTKMRYPEQEIPMKKTRGWEGLQGWLGRDPPGQPKLRCPCCCRKILRKKTKQTAHYRIFKV